MALQSGQAQIAGGLGPAQMVQAEDTAGADLILQAVRFGSCQYVTQWFTNNPDEFCAPERGRRHRRRGRHDHDCICNGVNQATGCDRWPDRFGVHPNIAGKTVSFVDQGSTSGYLIPALALHRGRGRPARRHPSTCSPMVTTYPSRPSTTATPKSACRSTMPVVGSPRRFRTSVRRSSCGAGRIRSRTTVSPSSATCRRT